MHILAFFTVDAEIRSYYDPINIDKRLGIGAVIFFITSAFFYFREDRNMRRLLITLLTVAIGFQSWGAPKTEIIVAAGASLKDALDEAGSLYESINADVKIIATYGSSGSMQKQIRQGAPIDILIPAATKQMNELQDEGLLVSGTRVTLLKNKVVLVVPKDNESIKGFRDLGAARIRQIAIGEPSSVPAGQYAEQIFKTLGILDEVKAKAVYAKDVRQVLAYVEEGEVDAGVVYATDAAIAKKARIAAYAPEGSHAPVEYPAAVVATGKSAEKAREFLEWLAGPKATEIFERYGFTVR